MNANTNVPAGSILSEILAFDPIDAAEKITGLSYKEDGGTSSLGVTMAILHNQDKTQLLESLGDTSFRTKTERYLDIALDLGFHIVLALPFYVPVGKYNGTARWETLYILFHPTKAILLKFDTYFGNVNGGNFYYCWRQKPGVDEDLVYRALSSGGSRLEVEEDESSSYIEGHHDCREALRHHISQLDEHGDFLNPWPANNKSFMWLLHYGDSDEEGRGRIDYKSINAVRLKMLPRKVLTKIPNLYLNVGEMVPVPEEELVRPKFHIAHFPVGTIFEEGCSREFFLKEGGAKKQMLATHLPLNVHVVTGIFQNGPNSWVLRTATPCDLTEFKSFNIYHVTRILKRGEGEVKMLNGPYKFNRAEIEEVLPRHPSRYTTVHISLLVQEIVDRYCKDHMYVDTSALTKHLVHTGVIQRRTDVPEDLAWCYSRYDSSSKKKLKKAILRNLNRFCINRRKAQREEDSSWG